MFIVGVHIGKNSEGTKNYGVRLTPQKIKIINGWIGNVNGSLNLDRQWLGD